MKNNYFLKNNNQNKFMYLFLIFIMWNKQYIKKKEYKNLYDLDRIK